MTLDFAHHLPKDSVDSLIIMLHGYGADKNDLIGLASHIGHALPNTAFLSPNAISPCDGGFGRQWFGLQSMDSDSIYNGVTTALPYVMDFIKQQMEGFKLPAEKVALLGFSQGTMLALHAGLQFEEKFAGVVGFSGLLAGSHMLDSVIKSRPPVCLIHGENDGVVDCEFSKIASDSLIKNDCHTDLLLCPNLEHGIDNEGLLFATQFLQKHLQPSH